MKKNNLAFTFASSEVNKFSQNFIKITELFTGKLKLKKLYDQYLSEDNPPENFWQDAVKKLKSSRYLESVFSGYKTHKNFWEKNSKGNWVRLRGWMKNYSSRQIRRYIIREDTGLACASRTKLWRQGKRIGNKVDIIENSDSFTSIDIHNNEDLLLAEQAKKIRSKKNG